MKLDSSIIVPVHNEEKILRENTKKLRRFLFNTLSSYEIILCENGSQDETLNIVKELAEEFDDVRFLTLPEPNLARALKEGFIAAKSDKIVYCPIDLSVNLDFIPAGVKLLDEYDVVIGSKRLTTELDKRPLARRLSSKAYHSMVRQFFGTELTDTTCVKVYRKDKILSIIERIPTTSRIFETELIVEAQREGFKIVELPVIVKEHRQSREGLLIKIYGKLEDLISVRLDHISIYVGIFFLLSGFLSIVFMSLKKLFTTEIGGFSNPYSFLISMMFVISGFQIISFGLLTNLLLQIRKEFRREFQET